MAHALLDDTMFYVGDTPWHTLGIKLPDPPTIGEALVHGNLDWQVKKKPTFFEDEQRTFLKRSVNVPTGYFVTVRKDNEGKYYPLGHVSERYEVLQNIDAFEPFKVLLDKGYTLETAGAVDLGKRVWILARRPSQHKVGDDVLVQYALLMNSHDGSTPVFLQPTDIRVVCQNTLNWAIGKNDPMRFTVKHTAGVKIRLQEVSDILKQADVNWSKAHEIMDMMHDFELNEQQAEAYFEATIDFLRHRGLSGTNELNVRHVDKATPVMEQLKPNFRFGRGNKGGTLWHADNAVTEYYDHQNKPRGDWVKSTQFGAPARYKLNAFKYASRVVTKNVAIKDLKAVA